MREVNFSLKSVEDTLIFGRKLGEILLKETENCVIGLVGPLGAGKTTLVKGISEGLSANDYVESPTFVFLNIYKGKLPLYHYDLYRVNSPKDFDDLGIFELVLKKGIHVIEWGDKIEGLLDFDIEIYFTIVSEFERLVSIKTFNLESVLDELSIS
ncbi:tRNA (adenosine(37)-N6)-threonylcarbamoyltransferase complex ATPase subunit type 1 TsaE [Caldisericum exile]|uniref:tRNA threonylcarbamoyladenosine biosynthesis protein TsaE n=1 Tax=Caldisericum exile (strain DSM 21853 / NBRC 104410 / AZM16c01) TaxID=511051 RepID=A0A7U6JG78_CALEA|nr:tRNA (adenosine(37)-N6)-threonylcarbamoyltransferase complex ATPase subunit type 1 TsaE [Caldisericum exile]BAL81349.1 putative ATPase [Caldisericum exile AZM16c01]